MNPRQRHRPSVGRLIHRVRRPQRIARYGFRVDQQSCDTRQCERRGRNAAPYRHLFLQNRKSQRGDRGQCHREALKGTRVADRDQSQAEQQRIRQGRFTKQARISAQHQRATRSCQTSAVITVDPVARHAETEHCQYCAEKRPLRRYPGLQHPAQRRTHPSAQQPDGDPRIAQEFSDRQHRALPRKKIRVVGRLMEDMQAFKKGPQRVSGIGEPPVRQGVGNQEMAEFIRYGRLRNRQQWQQRGANRQGKAEYRRHRDSFSLSEADPGSPNALHAETGRPAVQTASQNNRRNHDG